MSRSHALFVSVIALAGLGGAMQALAGADMPASAAALADGRAGPVVFTGDTLDQALAGLNDFLQDRYRVDDRLAHLDDPAAGDFAATALALSDVPGFAGTGRLGGFDGSIQGGVSLDLHLAAFNEELQSRDEPLFLRIAREAAAGTAAMDDAAGLPLATGPGSFGPGVMDDVTLDDSMVALADHLFDQQIRQAELEAGVWAVSDSAVDRYIETLRLY